MSIQKADLAELSKAIAAELLQGSPGLIAGNRLPTFDISAASSCCEGHCPCDSRNGGQCPCASKCSCDGKIAHHLDDNILLARLGELDKQKLEHVLQAAPVIAKLRGITPEL